MQQIVIYGTAYQTGIGIGFENNIQQDVELFAGHWRRVGEFEMTFLYATVFGSWLFFLAHKWEDLSSCIEVTVKIGIGFYQDVDIC